MLQEGFIKVFTQINQFEARGSLEGWILRIMVHTCINHLKKNKSFNDNIDLIHAENIVIKEDYIPATLQAKQVVESIRSLPIGYRTVLNLYAIEGYSHKEIGAMLDIEESTSRSQYTRAKSLLENLLLKRNIISRPITIKNWFSPVKIK
jgi:RNA polymerase sigma-70 factor (ECF subfamily)